MLVVTTALHVTGSGRWALLAGGLLLALLPAVSGSPLGGWSILGRRAHRMADWLAILLLAASPALPGRDGVSMLVLLGCAFVLWRVSAVTRYEPGEASRRPAREAPAAPAPPARAATPPPSGPPPSVPLAVRRGARKAGIAVGVIQRRRRGAR